MEINKKVFELSDDELDNVTGGTGENSPTEGGFSIYCLDNCHFNPSKYVPTDPKYVSNMCSNCVYNDNIGKMYSTCDYPNRHF